MTSKLTGCSPHRWGKCSITFQRVLGLTIKGALLTAQRVFDVLDVFLRILWLGSKSLADVPLASS